MVETMTRPFRSGPDAPRWRRRFAAPALAGLVIGAMVVLLGLRLDLFGQSAAGGATTELFSTPHVLFRSLEPGKDYLRIASVPTSDTSAPRAVSKERCQRLAAGPRMALCVKMGRSPAAPYEAAVLGADLSQQGHEAVNGTPSRARVSPDGKYYATTTFIDGHSYISLGFSTETVISHLDGRPVGNLEDFTFTINGEKNTRSDRNAWGVTFAQDSNTFFATMATNGRTYLVRGDLRSRTLTAVRDNAECPSLSPDGTTLVYKKRVGLTTDRAWRLHALDLRTGRERPLGEERSIDDQVAWLDDSHVMYAVAKPGETRTAADVYVAPLDGGPPRLLLRDADSPTVSGSF